MTRHAALAFVLLACGANSPDVPPLGDDDDETGGSVATGGVAGSGVPSGGTEPVGGGRAEQGGSSGTATGGTFPTGGAFPTGGVFPMGGTAPTGGASPQGGSVSTGGAPPTGGVSGAAPTGGTGGNPDPCASLGRVLWTQRSQRAFNAGLAPAPSTLEHSLRVWFTTPAGFCDELYASQGADAARFTLMNGQTGTFAIPLDNLCQATRFPTGQAIIGPGGNSFPAPKFESAVSGACLRVVRAQITASGEYLNGEVDVTWELRGP